MSTVRNINIRYDRLLSRFWTDSGCLLLLATITAALHLLHVLSCMCLMLMQFGSRVYEDGAGKKQEHTGTCVHLYVCVPL